MQMIWLLGAAAPAKKVHFNLNGSELRGFPIKARSGQSSILYANPLAPKAVARFCLCPAVITVGQCAHGSCLSKTLIPLAAPSPSLTYGGLPHRDRHQHVIPFHHLLERVAPLSQTCRDRSAGRPTGESRLLLRRTSPTPACRRCR